MPRTRYAILSPWFVRTTPHPKKSLSACRSCTSRRCWTTVNSGSTWNPEVISGCRFTPTKKQPSPSTKPTTHCASSFMLDGTERQVSEGSPWGGSLPCGLSPCLTEFLLPCRAVVEAPRTSIRQLYEEFPAYGSVLLRLASS